VFNCATKTARADKILPAWNGFFKGRALGVVIVVDEFARCECLPCLAVGVAVLDFDGFVIVFGAVVD